METSSKKKTIEQYYGPQPTKVRETDHYKKEYVQSFAQKWDQLINWEERAKGEGSFFIDLFRERKVQKVLDVATGTGFHSVHLRNAGFDVTSADGSPEMLAAAFRNGEANGQILKTVQADWRFLCRDIHEKYDAVICLGNSFTHLFSERDRRKALAEFYSVLRHDGILILDHRNYDSILDGKYSSSHKYYYCGKKVEVFPEYVDDGLARFTYKFNDGDTFHLNMYPLRRHYVQQLMYEVGFQEITTFADFQDVENVDEPDFYIHVAEKKYIPKKED